MATRTVLPIAFLALAACAAAPPPPPEPGPGAHAELENVFWACDYVATTRGIDSTPIRACTEATRELRRLKFDNSFHRMLEWWREHKPAEHERRRAAGMASLP